MKMKMKFEDERTNSFSIDYQKGETLLFEMLFPLFQYDFRFSRYFYVKKKEFILN